MSCMAIRNHENGKQNRKILNKCSDIPYCRYPVKTNSELPPLCLKNNKDDSTTRSFVKRGYYSQDCTGVGRGR